MTYANSNPEVEAWLRKLGWALSRMPSPEREGIVDETRAHMYERLARGLTPVQAVDGFGSPDAYARKFMDEMDLSGALGSQRGGDLLGAIARRVHRSLIALVAFVAVLCLFCLAAGGAVAMVMEVIDPVHTGLWVGEAGFFIGTNDDLSRARDIAGDKIYVVGAVLIAASYVFGRLILLGAVRALARR
jgi:uncharacterized membrane protein